MGRRIAAIYVALALIAAAIAVFRLAESTEMPGLAAWELLVLAFPWTLVLETPVGREADGVFLAALVLGGIGLNAGLIQAIGGGIAQWGRRRRSAGRPQ